MLLLNILCTLFIIHTAFTQNIDFILNQNNRSYQDALTNEIEKNYLNQYMNLSYKNIHILFEEWINTYSMIGINQPLLGKPHVELSFGLSLGLGEYHIINWNNTGLKIFDRGAGGMLDLNLSATFSSDKIPFLSNLKFWKNTDISFKFNNIYC
jgi:hypothetical protein